MKISDILCGAGVVLAVIGCVFCVRVNFISQIDSLVGLYISGAGFLLIVAGVIWEIFQNRRKDQ